MSRERLEFGINRASFGRGRRVALWTSFVVLASAVMTVAGLGPARFVRVAEAVETESSSWSESPSRKAGERKTLTIDGIEYAFRWIPAGSFMAGSPTSEREAAQAQGDDAEDELQHKATISRGFWMLEREITQEMWESVTRTNPSRFTGSKRLPVDNISWDECQEYVKKLNGLGVCPEGFEFSLPTEAEWEYACRAGATTAYYFGDSLNGNQANCDGTEPFGTEEKGERLLKTSAAGMYPANAWGLFDMHGNVREWVLDVYAEYAGGDVVDYVKLDGGSRRVCRGGGWSDGAVFARSASRDGYASKMSDAGLGARLALRPTTKASGASRLILGGSKATGAGSVGASSGASSWSQSSTREAGECRTLTVNGVEYAFRWIPAGEFVMGSSLSEQEEAADPFWGVSGDETQRVAVFSRGFWMLESEITQEMWESVAGSNPSYFTGSKRLPVEQVSWDDCQDFISKLNELGVCPEGYKFSLPTEAEWEYACRAGSDSAYHFGDCLNGDQANCDGNFPFGTSRTGENFGKTREVGAYPANAWGLFDMHGNVYEWTLDVYAEYPTDDVVDYARRAGGVGRVYRGGSWLSFAVNCRAADRQWKEPDVRARNLGARLVLRPL